MIIAGASGTFFVVPANSWMNNPTGFRLDEAGRVVDPQPVAVMFGPSMPAQVVHTRQAAEGRGVESGRR